MCEAATGSGLDAGLVAPRPALGDAIDPIGLEPVDEVVVTTLVDNVYDALLPSDERTSRASFGVALAEAPQFEDGQTAV
jgi:7,8-dihydropterin-6-yl-methyl-4-(beta-D-ribofuranosyl)aminobenzene 5'-phosphate synthase